jgi:hypothetical protein
VWVPPRNVLHGCSLFSIASYLQTLLANQRGAGHCWYWCNVRVGVEPPPELGIEAEIPVM